ncbi:unnamed protein product [Polarella glacialis]|uniref:Uncharacterized protein n=1 Tax=Polarella glacialis TaxID=89957 RepID=A0A813KYM9_POLGL|nr:unnamed protein product [Polarella glacialis]
MSSTSAAQKRTMGWEYRVFFRAPPSSRACPEAGDGEAEARTDVYLPHSASVGVKHRGGGGLELKLRREVDERGFEKWEKFRVADAAELEAQLAGEGFPPLPSACAVHLTKHRRQKVKSSGAAEETAVTLRFDDDHAPARASLASVAGASSQGPVEEWRSIAVEGKRKKCGELAEQLLSRLSALGATDVVVCGYAEFVVARVAAQRPSSQTAARTQPAQAAVEAGAEVLAS